MTLRDRKEYEDNGPMYIHVDEGLPEFDELLFECCVLIPSRTSPFYSQASFSENQLVRHPHTLKYACEKKLFPRKK